MTKLERTSFRSCRFFGDASFFTTADDRAGAQRDRETTKLAGDDLNLASGKSDCVTDGPWTDGSYNSTATTAVDVRLSALLIARPPRAAHV